MANQIALGMKQKKKKKNSIQPTDQAMTNQKLRIWSMMQLHTHAFSTGIAWLYLI